MSTKHPYLYNKWIDIYRGVFSVFSISFVVSLCCWYFFFSYLVYIARKGLHKSNVNFLRKWYHYIFARSMYVYIILLCTVYVKIAIKEIFPKYVRVFVCIIVYMRFSLFLWTSNFWVNQAKIGNNWIFQTKSQRTTSKLFYKYMDI